MLLSFLGKPEERGLVWKLGLFVFRKQLFKTLVVTNSSSTPIIYVCPASVYNTSFNMAALPQISSGYFKGIEFRLNIDRGDWNDYHSLDGDPSFSC